ncbi:methyltransferase domain-containing protein [Imbroritus primus]|uniref:Methyltransferase domain-containing protein n=1 Tax=Imbroritus primus TaxID=3058603 RepID=A0ACD3STU1_9BURK|nr:methyltransferase domain-containing protein [Burkholderiaceae bacterium PBA]
MSSATASSRQTGREFLFTPHDFSRIRSLIYRRAGIALSERKSEMVYSRLARRLRAVNHVSFAAYLDALEGDQLPGEWEAFTNALTTNLTAFFREAHHFPVLADHARTRLARGEPYRVWCSASSTGEEPYSIAMTLADAAAATPGARNAAISVLASDVDTSALAKAQAGVYPLERVNALSPAQLKQHFLRGTGRRAGLARVQPQLQALVTFQQINLLAEEWPLTERFDAIFCRNVMIYFDKPTQSRILQRFERWLKPDGLLFAGHSENFTSISQAFSLRGKTVYALRAAGSAGA